MQGKRKGSADRANRQFAKYVKNNRKEYDNWVKRHEGTLSADTKAEAIKVKVIPGLWKIFEDKSAMKRFQDKKLDDYSACRKLFEILQGVNTDIQTQIKEGSDAPSQAVVLRRIVNLAIQKDTTEEYYATKLLEDYTHKSFHQLQDENDPSDINSIRQRLWLFFRMKGGLFDRFLDSRSTQATLLQCKPHPLVETLSKLYDLLHPIS